MTPDVLRKELRWAIRRHYMVLASYVLFIVFSLSGIWLQAKTPDVTNVTAFALVYGTIAAQMLVKRYDRKLQAYATMLAKEVQAL